MKIKMIYYNCNFYFMKVIGKMVSPMEMDKQLLQIIRGILENFKRIAKELEKGFIYFEINIGIDMKENFTKENWMVREVCIIEMEIHIKGIGNKT